MGAVHQSAAGDGMDFVSATVPRQQPQIIKNMANKKVSIFCTQYALPHMHFSTFQALLLSGCCC